MGVDQYTSQHVFEPLPTGGRIVLQRKEADSAGEAVIREHMRTMRSDGSVTPEERRALKQQWRQISRQVCRARHRG